MKFSEAHDRIDAILAEPAEDTEQAEEQTPEKVAPRITEKVAINFLKNRTIDTETDLNQALDELRDKCLTELEAGKKVRLV